MGWEVGVGGGGNSLGLRLRNDSTALSTDCPLSLKQCTAKFCGSQRIGETRGKELRAKPKESICGRNFRLMVGADCCTEEDSNSGYDWRQQRPQQAVAALVSLLRQTTHLTFSLCVALAVWPRQAPPCHPPPFLLPITLALLASLDQYTP